MIKGEPWFAEPNADDTAMLIRSNRWIGAIAAVHSYAAPTIGPNRHQRDAIAQLMAAAPELIYLLSQYRNECSGTPRTAELLRLNAAAADLLAKAGAA